MKFGICTLALGLLLSTPAWAGETTRTFTGQNGKTTTSTTSTTRDPENNTLNRATITTYPNGQTSSTNSNYRYNGSGSYSGDVTHTNRNGETGNYKVEGQRTRTNGTVTNTGTITGANGNQGTYSNNRTCASGECTFNRSATNANGQTRQVNGDATRTGKGSYSGNATVTGRNGNVRSGTFTRSR
jgi:hypothetical protein